jgi:transcriptional regulator with XRE-family HTH domain
VDIKIEISEFLTSRRARITPEQAGLSSYGCRRVPGLRREEVAVLAGVSIQYYTRLERGDVSGASQSVLEALARALELDDAERAHLFDLARAAQPTGAPPRRRRTKQRVRPEVQWTLDAITGAAAFVGNQRLDRLAANHLGRALFSEIYAAPTRPVNSARFVFLDPRAERFYYDWDRVADWCVATLRSAAGRDPHDHDLLDLVGELSTHSDAFRTRWAAHDVRFHKVGVTHFHHPVVGELTVNLNRFDLPTDDGQTLFTYTAEPGSRSEEALRLLGSWTATTAPAEPSRHRPTLTPRTKILELTLAAGQECEIARLLGPQDRGHSLTSSIHAGIAIHMRSRPSARFPSHETQVPRRPSRRGPLLPLRAGWLREQYRR